MAINLGEILGDFKGEVGRYSSRIKSAGVPEVITARNAINRNSALAGTHRAISTALGRVMGGNAKYSPYAAGALIAGGALAGNQISKNIANNHPVMAVPLVGIKLAGLGASILDPALMPSLLKSAMKTGARTVSEAATKTKAAGISDVGKTILNKIKAPVVHSGKEDQEALVASAKQKHQLLAKEITDGFDDREASAISTAFMEQFSGVEARRAGYENLKAQHPSVSTPISRLHARTAAYEAIQKREASSPVETAAKPGIEELRAQLHARSAAPKATQEKEASSSVPKNIVAPKPPLSTQDALSQLDKQNSAVGIDSGPRLEGPSAGDRYKNRNYQNFDPDAPSRFILPVINDGVVTHNYNTAPPSTSFGFINESGRDLHQRIYAKRVHTAAANAEGYTGEARKREAIRRMQEEGSNRYYSDAPFKDSAPAIVLNKRS